MSVSAGAFRGVCKKIDHFPEDADYEQDTAEYLLRESPRFGARGAGGSPGSPLGAWGGAHASCLSCPRGGGGGDLARPLRQDTV